MTLYMDFYKLVRHTHKMLLRYLVKYRFFSSDRSMTWRLALPSQKVDSTVTSVMFLIKIFSLLQIRYVIYSKLCNQNI